MDQEMKKTAPATTPAPLDDAALEDVSGGAVYLNWRYNACPDCGERLDMEQDELYIYNVCSACGYREKVGQHTAPLT